MSIVIIIIIIIIMPADIYLLNVNNKNIRIACESVQGQR